MDRLAFLPICTLRAELQLKSSWASTFLCTLSFGCCMGRRGRGTIVSTSETLTATVCGTVERVNKLVTVKAGGSWCR